MLLFFIFSNEIQISLLKVIIFFIFSDKLKISLLNVSFSDEKFFLTKIRC